MTKLSVNLNKVALLRNQRDIGYPSVVEHAGLVLDAGAHGVTIHPRPDERHIRRQDVKEIAAYLKERGDKAVEFNIEGYPSDDFLELVLSVPCDQVTLVPDDPDQRTSDHGWNIARHEVLLREVTETLAKGNRRVSIFIDPDADTAKAAAQIGAQRVELYTGPYAFDEIKTQTYVQAAKAALDAGLAINAGHDLNLDNLARFIAAIPETAEVSIGHAITADALIYGWNGAVAAYLSAIEYGKKEAAANQNQNKETA